MQISCNALEKRLNDSKAFKIFKPLGDRLATRLEKKVERFADKHDLATRVPIHATTAMDSLEQTRKLLRETADVYSFRSLYFTSPRSPLLELLETHKLLDAVSEHAAKSTNSFREEAGRRTASGMMLALAATVINVGLFIAKPALMNDPMQILSYCALMVYSMGRITFVPKAFTAAAKKIERQMDDLRVSLARTALELNRDMEHFIIEALIKMK